MQETKAAGAVPVVVGPVALADWLRLLRPHQWVKNAFILAPLLFSGQAVERGPALRSLGAFVLFCALASAVYVLNDVLDRDADRAHPTKRLRPVAAGRVPVASALACGGLLLVVAAALAWPLPPAVGLLGLAYLALNVLYSLRLKQVVILDVFAIASFFVLRLLVGAAAVPVEPSVWLLLCGALLALYLGFAKRRHELVLLGDTSRSHRSVLTHYGPLFLDQMSAVLLSVTVIAYIMYTLTSETAAEVGSDALVYSTVFVLYGVFRYLYLVHQRNGGSPTEALLTDRALIVDVTLWLAYCAWVLYRPF